MIRIGIIAIAISITLVSCNGQKTKQDKESKEELNTPQTNIKVDKQYDKNGNLLKFDSTYSYYYSNVKSDTNLRDSIFNDFKNQFNQRYFFSKDRYFNDFFFVDSLLKYDFYKKDFFINRYRNNMNRIDSLFRSMDSLKNSFFNKQFNPRAPLFVPKK